MQNHYKTDPWQIVEEGFDPAFQEASESIFSLGNGRMGQRANFEEQYSGDSLQGNYLAGVYYPDKTRVGWWKIGYPEYFAKVLNAPNWIGIGVEIAGLPLDLHRVQPQAFRRVLDMRRGYLERIFSVEIGGQRLEIAARRFLSMKRDEIGAIRYAIRSEDFTGRIVFTPYINGNVENRDANYGERFWEMEETGTDGDSGYLMARTKKSGFVTCMTMGYTLELEGRTVGQSPEATRRGNTAVDPTPNVIRRAGDPAAEATRHGNTAVDPTPNVIHRDGYVAHAVSLNLEKGGEAVCYKYVSVLTSLTHDPAVMREAGAELMENARQAGFDTLFEEHAAAWEEKWAHSDIIIEGDVKAQQGIRFNIFQLNQTYTGTDERLNIGPKGFTGEKYGGSTYWDTEAYLIPFYLSTAPEEVSRNLLIYRYKHLEKAIENGRKLGFTGGAALYPMVTMNGEECHNEWEITFEEIHRNGAIAYAIYNYTRYTGKKDYLAQYGLEVLIGISRFWRQRVNWSDVKGRYVILGVTGPNEYENNVNNNWYTNKIAQWTLQYTLEVMDYVRESAPRAYDRIVERTALDVVEETGAWSAVIRDLYFPFEEAHGVFLQQEGYMDKEQQMASNLHPSRLPLNQHWSWDRILRSCFIKQADVLQGLYFFEDEYDLETIRKHFEFYEPRTVHESSLSPCVHSILAARIGRMERAYELYLRTSRLDLDDYNHEVDEGLHITSMGGTWMSVVYGFGGMRIRDGMLSFEPGLPGAWRRLSFKIMFRGRILSVDIGRTGTRIGNLDGEGFELLVAGKKASLEKGGFLEAKI